MNKAVKTNVTRIMAIVMALLMTALALAAFAACSGKPADNDTQTGDAGDKSALTDTQKQAVETIYSNRNEWFYLDDPAGGRVPCNTINVHFAKNSYYLEVEYGEDYSDNCPVAFYRVDGNTLNGDLDEAEYEYVKAHHMVIAWGYVKPGDGDANVRSVIEEIFSKINSALS